MLRIRLARPPQYYVPVKICLVQHAAALLDHAMCVKGRIFYAVFYGCLRLYNRRMLMMSARIFQLIKPPEIWYLRAYVVALEPQ